MGFLRAVGARGRRCSWERGTCRGPCLKADRGARVLVGVRRGARGGDEDGGSGGSGICSASICRFALDLLCFL